ncbi:hypothetical protein ACMGD3_20015 [Lysinibacillus sphaericus]|uniref:hypothetical protein n=1 Tax=Lysinibacillus sphaericus TaxID=1421 RepID=UPI003F79E3F5
MEQHEQMTGFDLDEQYKEMQFCKPSTNVNKPVDKKKPSKGPRIVGILCGDK